MNTQEELAILLEQKKEIEQRIDLIRKCGATPDDNAKLWFSGAEWRKGDFTLSVNTINDYVEKHDVGYTIPRRWYPLITSDDIKFIISYAKSVSKSLLDIATELEENPGLAELIKSNGISLLCIKDKKKYEEKIEKENYYDLHCQH